MHDLIPKVHKLHKPLPERLILDVISRHGGVLLSGSFIGEIIASWQIDSGLFGSLMALLGERFRECALCGDFARHMSYHECIVILLCGNEMLRVLQQRLRVRDNLGLYRA